MRNAATVAADEGTDSENGAVHAWRVNRLTGLGLASTVAEVVADEVDWHDIARLVQCQCPASLAVLIVA